MTAVRRAILLIGALFTVVGHSEEIEIKASSIFGDSEADVCYSALRSLCKTRP